MMESNPREVRIYVTKGGRSPFIDWIQALTDTRARALIRARIARVRIGNLGDCKPLGEGVLELRIDYGPGYRVYFGEEEKTLVILLCGGRKRTQERDIKKAHKYWLDYRSRKDAKK